MSAEELKQHGLSYKDLDYGDEAARVFLLGLLKRANEENGFKYRCFSKMLIEVFPSPGFGCVIYFTCVEEREPDKKSRLRLKRRRGSPYIYEFENSTDLLDALRALAKAGIHMDTEADSVLYLIDGRYRLVIYPAGEYKSSMLFILEEYGRKVSGSAASEAYLSEHGKVLAEGDVVEKIGGLLI